MMRMRRGLCVIALAGLALVGCSGSPEQPSQATGIIVESPWVRTTDDATDSSMTALFVTLTNPTATDITLQSADCSSVAGMTQIHEMVEVDGQMVMQEAEAGAVVPKESHLHLTPGGTHVMLMGLKTELPAGDEVSCSLEFDNGQSIELTAPVKVFTEEEDHYHTPSPSPSS